MHIAHAFLELDIFSFFKIFCTWKTNKKKKNIFFLIYVFFSPSSDFTLLFEDFVWLISVLVDFTAAYTQRWKVNILGLCTFHSVEGAGGRGFTDITHAHTRTTTELKVVTMIWFECLKISEEFWRIF